MPLEAPATDSAYHYVYDGDIQVSRHALEKNAVVAAANLSFKCGGCEIQVRQNKVIRVTWKAEPSPDVKQVELSWDRPLNRANGEALPADEIQGYRIKHVSVNGEEIIEAGNVYSYTLNVETGLNEFLFATVDTRQQQSVWSESIQVDVE